MAKHIDRDKLDELVGKDNARVIMSRPQCMMAALTFASTLTTSNGLDVIEHNHQEIADGKYITTDDFSSEFPSNSTGMISRDHGEWTYPLWPQMNLQGSPQTPYIYDSRPNINDIADGLKHWYNLSKEDRIKRGKSGREWSIEHGFTHKGMGDAAINAIDTCFKEFVPRNKFQIIDTVEKPIKYEEGILI